MSEDIINQAIESTAVETSQPIETPQEITATEENAPPQANEPEDAPFPKKAVNALSRRDKQIGKLQAQLAAERQELLKYRQTTPQAPVNAAPDESKYDNYGEFLEAKILHKFQKEQAEAAKTQQESFHAEQDKAWESERVQYIDTQAEEAAKSIPDYISVIEEYSQEIVDMPQHIKRAFLEADNGALALYALAKEGKLESILNMSPYKAAIEIGKAELRGESISKTKYITKAPAPIEGLKGVGSSTKPISGDSSWSELQKWLNTK